jgi:S-adenosylmethionine synthetase
VERVPGLLEVYVWLCSQIGQPINAPLVAAAQVVLQHGVGLAEVRPSVEAIIEQELANVHGFGERLARGEFLVW